MELENFDLMGFDTNDRPIINPREKALY